MYSCLILIVLVHSPGPPSGSLGGTRASITTQSMNCTRSTTSEFQRFLPPPAIKCNAVGFIKRNQRNQGSYHRDKAAYSRVECHPTFLAAVLRSRAQRQAVHGMRCIQGFGEKVRLSKLPSLLALGSELDGSSMTRRLVYFLHVNCVNAKARTSQPRTFCHPQFHIGTWSRSTL